MQKIIGERQSKYLSFSAFILQMGVANTPLLMDQVQALNQTGVEAGPHITVAMLLSILMVLGTIMLQMAAMPLFPRMDAVLSLARMEAGVQ